MAVRWSGGVPELLVDARALRSRTARPADPASAPRRGANGPTGRWRAAAVDQGAGRAARRVARADRRRATSSSSRRATWCPAPGSGSAVATGAADVRSSAHAPPAARPADRRGLRVRRPRPRIVPAPRLGLGPGARRAHRVGRRHRRRGRRGRRRAANGARRLPPPGARRGRRRRTRGGRAPASATACTWCSAPSPRRRHAASVVEDPGPTDSDAIARRQRARAGPRPGRRRGPRRRGAVAFGGRRGAW